MFNQILRLFTRLEFEALVNSTRAERPARDFAQFVSHVSLGSAYIRGPTEAQNAIPVWSLL